MKISGFAMVRNAGKFYFPIKESILSILPLVDEFIVAVGKGEDNTLEDIKSINSSKIKIYERVWDEALFKDGEILRQETNFALSKCTGDWCFYLQADEVAHENDLEEIYKNCKNNLNNLNVHGFLFNYLHFWGDYQHYLPYHGWYKNEIRIIRNNIGIESYKDAQSFRNNNNKLNVMPLKANIYHYGWVRPPDLMKNKKKEQDGLHWGRKKAEDINKNQPNYFDYGPLKKIPIFKGSHPQVMQTRIKEIFWEDKLNYNLNKLPHRELFKHEKTKYILITWIENNIFRGKQLFGYKNWKKIKH